jgi:hypothetical protein
MALHWPSFHKPFNLEISFFMMLTSLFRNQSPYFGSQLAYFVANGRLGFGVKERRAGAQHL